jgi:hypothetical protein
MENFRYRTLLLPALLVLVLAACAPTVPAGDATPDEVLPPAAVLEAQQWLADQMDAAPDEIEIQTVEQTEWPDACLGLGGPDEMCAEVITPGWHLVFSVDGEEYEIRTNEDASSIRMVTPGEGT